jgi:hypothetical protein
MNRVLLLSVALAPAVASCASTPAMRAARAGDHAALGRAVAARERAGDLSNGEAASLAREVADRELRSAAGSDAVDRVRDVRPCAHELDGALAARGATHDEAGAEAMLARIDAHAVDVDDGRGYLSDGDPRWRAVGARALVRSEDRDARLRALLDPDPSVRRAAARAARDARDPGDGAALADAARRDPEPIVRTEAVRSIAVLPATADGRNADVLRDLWTVGDDALREDIALAWSGPELWGAGGREALRVVVASDHGPGVVEAAAAVLRRGDAQGELAEVAMAQLVRALQRGPTQTRVQALAQSPVGAKELRPIVEEMADSDDGDIRVAALARLANEKDARAVAKLEGLAQPGSPLALRARLALGSAGDRRVQAWLESDLVASEPSDRLAAATALASLGIASRAAPLLADPDARVRMRAACTILLADRRDR